MSDLFDSRWLQWIPVGVLVASLLGSGHCVAMCGGLVSSVAKTRRQVFEYHLGRLWGYATLGALAGFVGARFLRTPEFGILPWLSTGLLAAGFMVIGWRIWKGQAPHLFRLPPQVWERWSQAGPGVTGLLSAFLPCGWLHTFILGAVATQSPLRGALYLTVFWIGTLPALSLAPLAFRTVLGPFARRAPRLAAILLVALGVGTLALKMGGATHGNHPSASGCHCSNPDDNDGEKDSHE